MLDEIVFRAPVVVEKSNDRLRLAGLQSRGGHAKSEVNDAELHVDDLTWGLGLECVGVRLIPFWVWSCVVI